MAWRNVLVLGLVACGVVVGCTVTAGDGDNKDGGEGVGDAGDGDSSTPEGGKTGSGGAASTGGGKASGGSSAGGGTASGGAADTCQPNRAGNDDCGKCIETKCCDSYLACTTDECAGNGTTDGEVACFHQCISDAVTKDGTADNDTVIACSDKCAIGSLLADDSQDLVTCILGDTSDAGVNSGCSVECYTVDLSRH